MRRVLLCNSCMVRHEQDICVDIVNIIQEIDTKTKKKYTKQLGEIWELVDGLITFYDIHRTS